MKIAQVVSYQESVPPRSKNGLEFLVSWLTEELVKRGHQVTLFAPADSKTKAKLKSICPTNINNDKNVVWYFTNYSNWNVSYVLSEAENFDIIHTHTLPALFTYFTGRPIIHTLHTPFSEEDEKFRKHYLINKKYAKYLKYIIDSYKKINYVTISKFQQKNFKKCEPYYFKNYTHIYNGIPVEKFILNNQPADYLIFLGYLCTEKGAHIAVRVARKLKRKLILAGEYYEKEPTYFNKYIKPFLNKDIKYVGPVGFREKNELLKNASACLAPIQWDEPFGLVPVEAQACGTPVIAFKRGAMPEIISHGHTGFVVKTEKEMVEAVKKIDKIERHDCRQWVEKNFTVKRMTDEYEKLYRKLIKKI